MDLLYSFEMPAAVADDIEQPLNGCAATSCVCLGPVAEWFPPDLKVSDIISRLDRAETASGLQLLLEAPVLADCAAAVPHAGANVAQTTFNLVSCRTGRQ